MPAFVVVDILVTDPSAYEEYKRLASQSIQAFGGSYLVRGGASQVLEGSWQPNRLVLLQFDTLERAQAWYASPEYARAKEARNNCAQLNMVAMGGL